MDESSFHSAWITADGAVNSTGSVSSAFPWWSFTKTVMAICALRLFEDGQLDLDAQLRDKPYTLRQLLQHRSGLPDYGPLKTYHEAVARNDTPWSRDRLLDAVGGDQLVFPPGSGWAYSNVGYMLVRETIEEITGRDLATTLRDMVFAPLPVPSVRLAATPADFSEVFWPDLRTYDPRWVYPGCLIGTPVDAAMVLHALLRGWILKPATLRSMLNRHDLGDAVPGRPWTACGYGLGLMSGLMGEAARAIGHSGAGPHSVNAVYHFPDLAVPITVATFTSGDTDGPAEAEAMSIALRVGQGLLPTLSRR
ncbi:serine hydrolase domain-containing protein [Mesorhizobium sp. WSM2239]|uniref:Serine hydrolase domain-containing protein n=2 Tax=unclassified Mesorhizobium TaxID=325217 RepID=A0AAU8DGE7_9HYPH